MNAPLRSKNKKYFAVRGPHRRNSHRTGNALPALLALGGSCALVCGSASALELGPLEMHSSLGQPLRASVAFALNPGERIQDFCIFLGGGRSADGLPSVTRAEIAVSGGTIRLTGHTPVLEPLLSLQLTVACPQTANLTREYSILVDPQTPPWSEPERPVATMVAQSASQAPSPHSAERVREQRPVSVARSVPASRSAERAPVASGSPYRVQRGDTLSGIAQRIPGRTVTIWQAADAIFAANPDAFQDNDPDRLQAGTILVIPATLHAESVEPAVVAPTVAAPPAVEPVLAEPSAVVPSAVVPAVAEPAAAVPATAVAATVRTEAAVTPPAPAIPSETSPVPRAGDVSPAAGGPFVVPAEIVQAAVPEAPAAEPAARAPAPAAGRAPSGTARDQRSWSSLGWLGGSGVLLILGLLFGGRALRNWFAGGSAALTREDIEGPAGDPVDEASDAPIEVDVRFDDAVADARMIALDADLDAGTGLQEGGEIQVAQDFGFSAAGDLQAPLDIDFAAEPALRQDDDSAMITVKRRTPDGILVREILPGSDEEFSQYDLSMIVDATRQPAPGSDATTKDLKAIELDTVEVSPDDSVRQTLTDEVDYRILEQDYEDELTATQALNAQLMAAARDLTRKLGAEDSTEPALSAVPSADLDLDLTALLEPNDATTALEPTLDAESRPLGNTDDTGINEELTTKMPAAENDAFADLEIESDTIDTRPMKVS